MNKSLSIIIPCYNEHDRLTRNIPLILEYCDTNLLDYELLFVNDGSTDDTLKILQSINHPKIHVRSYTPNRGKGYAVRTGLLAAGKDLALFMDADLATDLSCIKRALDTASWIPKNDLIIIGNRELPESIIIASPMRKFIGRVFNSLQYIILGIDISDTQCGFKMLTHDAIKTIVPKMRIDRWAFDVELLYLAQKYGILIEHIPVVWHDVAGSKVHPMTDSIKMFNELWRIRRMHK